MFNNMGLLNYDDGMEGEGPAPAPAMPGVRVTPRRAMPGQIDVPPVQAAMLPPQAPVAPRSLLQRVGDALSDGRNNLSNAIRPKLPPGFSGLGMTPEEMEAARPGLLRSIIHEPGMSAADKYQKNLEGLFDRKKSGADLQRQKEIMSGRADIMKRFPTPKQGDFASFSSWVEQVYPALMELGDYEGVKNLNAAMQQVLAAQGQQGKPVDDVEWLDMGTEKWLTQKSTGKILGKEKKPVDPNAVNPGQELREQRMVGRIQGLTDDFTKVTEARRKSSHQMLQAINDAPRAIGGDGASQMAILYAFINGLDPESVVREGEVALARAAAPFWEQARSLYSKYIMGESVLVPDGMIGTITELMQRRLEGNAQYINGKVKYYSGLAELEKIPNGAYGKMFEPLTVPEKWTPLPKATPRAGGHPNYVKKEKFDIDKYIRDNPVMGKPR